jgi:hypothetical protein
MPSAISSAETVMKPVDKLVIIEAAVTNAKSLFFITNYFLSILIDFN